MFEEMWPSGIFTVRKNEGFALVEATSNDVLRILDGIALEQLPRLISFPKISQNGIAQPHLKTVKRDIRNSLIIQTIYNTFQE